MMSWLKHPFFICLLLGAIAWKAWSALYPPMLGEVAYPSPARVSELRESWFRSTGRLPDEAALAGLIQRDINDTILLSEAQRLKMYIGDPVIERRLLQDAEFLGLKGEPEKLRREILALGVLSTDQLIRRRLIQRLESIGRGRVDPAAAPLAELQQLYDAEPGRWIEAPLLRFTQLYFSSDKADAAERAAAALEQIKQQNIGPGADELNRFGDVFLHGRSFGPLRDYALQGIFGSSFMQAMQAQGSNTGAWLGPLPSSYGFHLVWVSDYSPARTKTLAEVESKLRRDWAAREELKQFREFMARLRERYIISGAPAGA